MNTPKCDGVEGCCEPVAYIDVKGFAYCTKHGLQRKQSVRCRKLKPKELATLKQGKPLERY